MFLNTLTKQRRSWLAHLCECPEIKFNGWAAIYKGVSVNAQKFKRSKREKDRSSARSVCCRTESLRKAAKWRRSASPFASVLRCPKTPPPPLEPSGMSKITVYLFTRFTALLSLPLLTLLVRHRHRQFLSSLCFIFKLLFNFPFLTLSDHIFDERSSNASVYELLAKDIIHSALDGFNGIQIRYSFTSHIYYSLLFYFSYFGSDIRLSLSLAQVLNNAVLRFSNDS